MESGQKWRAIAAVLTSVVIVGATGIYIGMAMQAGKTANQTTTDTNSSTTLTTTTATATTPSVSETANWKTYTNSSLGFSFKYPQDWTLSNATTEESQSGKIVSLVSPEAQKQNLPPGYDRNLVVSYFKDMNSDAARGGSWEGQRTYKSLVDYFTDQKAPTENIGETAVDGKKGYEVAIGGFGISFGIMVEYNGIYKLNFSIADSKKDLGSVEKQILSTFKFTN